MRKMKKMERWTMVAFRIPPKTMKELKKKCELHGDKSRYILRALMEKLKKDNV
jgi:hypothetical protein